jgi:hypothetical protein
VKAVKEPPLLTSRHGVFCYLLLVWPHTHTSLLYNKKKLLVTAVVASSYYETLYLAIQQRYGRIGVGLDDQRQ